MKIFATCLIGLSLWAGTCRAADINLATMSCVRYQNEMLASTPAPASADPINTVMWLFGYAVAKSGEHVMYGEALASFGFSLDAECKSNPSESLLDALSVVKPSSKNPMDLSTLDCATFAGRHVELARTDHESADTIMMWLFGFAVATSGSHIFDTAGLNAFEPALLAECTKHPDHSLFTALAAVKTGARH
jgi:hypothetical protein